ncbi:MAG: TSUP family transporter [Spirochaeta sp.]|nr:TSUP family transporter [Spirochaeta sp.]
MITLSGLMILQLILLGAVAGTFGGLLGIGGGIIIMPFFLQIGIMTPTAHAAGLLLSSLTGISATTNNLKIGNLKGRTVSGFIPGAVTGVLLGASFQIIFKLVFPGSDYTLVFKLLFILMLLYSLYRMTVKLFHTLLAGRDKNAESLSTPISRSIKVLITLPGGFLAGVLGIGGGAYYVPMLRSLGRLAMKESVSVSSALIAVSLPVGALLAQFFLLINGRAVLSRQSLILSLFTGLGILAGSYAGARLLKKIPAIIVAITFVALLIYNIIRLCSGLVVNF